MRVIKTFILRLVIDSDTPDRLCGDIRPLDERERFPFQTEVRLDELLHSLSTAPMAGVVPALEADQSGMLPKKSEDAD